MTNFDKLYSNNIRYISTCNYKTKSDVLQEIHFLSKKVNFKLPEIQELVGRKIRKISTNLTYDELCGIRTYLEEQYLEIENMCRVVEDEHSDLIETVNITSDLVTKEALKNISFDISHESMLSNIKIVYNLKKVKIAQTLFSEENCKPNGLESMFKLRGLKTSYCPVLNEVYVLAGPWILEGLPWGYNFDYNGIYLSIYHENTRCYDYIRLKQVLKLNAFNIVKFIYSKNSYIVAGPNPLHLPKKLNFRDLISIFELWDDMYKKEV